MAEGVLAQRLQYHVDELREVLAIVLVGIRAFVYALRRRPAPLRGIALRIRAAVPGADGKA